MIDQEQEIRQMKLEQEIDRLFHEIYEALKKSDRLEAESAIGYVAQARAAWDGEESEPA